MKTLKTVFAYISFLTAFLIIAPLAAGITHEGMIFSALFAAIGIVLLSPRWYRRLCEKLRWLNMTVYICFAAAIAVCLVISGFMLNGAIKPTATDSGTVIVLGCQVSEDGPSPMLVKRMNRAIEYLDAHPQSVVVASGAMGKGESMPEAHAIRDYLLENGIEESRIFVEDKSGNTEQNLRFSAEIIEKYGLDKNVVTVTNGFHQYCASVFAARNGLNATPLSSKTAPSLAVTYWFREILGIMRLVILNY